MHEGAAEADVAEARDLEASGVLGGVGNGLSAVVLGDGAEADVAEGVVGEEVGLEGVAGVASGALGLEGLQAPLLGGGEGVLLAVAEAVVGGLVGDEGSLVGGDGEGDASGVDLVVAEGAAEELGVAGPGREDGGDVGGMVGGEVEGVDVGEALGEVRVVGPGVGHLDGVDDGLEGLGLEGAAVGDGDLAGLRVGEGVGGAAVPEEEGGEGGGNSKIFLG